MENQHTPSLDNNLELWISFTESTITDKTGKHKLTSSGSMNPTTVQGQLGQAFTSKTQEVDLAQENGISLWNPCTGVDSYSICAWFEAPLRLDQDWSTLTRGREGDHQVLVNRDGSLGVYDNVGGTSFHPCGFNMKTLTKGWHHLIAIASKGQTQFFIDTKLAGTSDFQSHSNLTSIGNSIYGGQPWGGKIKDVRVYLRPLTEIEIAKLFQKSELEGELRGEISRRKLNPDSVLKFGGLVHKSGEKQPDQVGVAYDFAEMFNNPKLSDVCFKVDGSLLYAHKVILCAQSKVFHAMFLSGMKESQQSVIELAEVDLATFSIFLQFFYTHSVNAPLNANDNNNSVDIISLLKLADQYDFPALRKTCLGYLTDTNIAELSTDTVLDFALIGLEYSLVEVVSNCSQHLISYYGDKIKPILNQIDDKILVLLLHALHYYPL